MGLWVLYFEEKSFFNTILKIASYSDYKPHYTGNGEEIIGSITIDTINIKCDCIDGSVVNGLRHPILFDFVLDKPSG